MEITQNLNYWKTTGEELDKLEEIFNLDFIDACSPLWTYLHAHIEIVGLPEEGFFFPDYSVSFLFGVLFNYMLQMQELGKLHMLREAEPTFAKPKPPQRKVTGDFRVKVTQASEKITSGIAEKMVQGAKEPNANVFTMRTLFNDVIATYAPRTGRYQGMLAYNDGRLMVEVPVNRILAVLDGRTCHFCSRMNGELLVPGIPSPPYHYSCRCVVSSMT